MRVHLSYSVVTWRKELDLSFKPKLEVELTIFTNPWVWIWGLTLNETWVLWGHSQSSLKDKGAASQRFKTGLGRRPWLSKAPPHKLQEEQSQCLPAWCSFQIPSLRQRDRRHGSGPPCSLLPTWSFGSGRYLTAPSTSCETPRASSSGTFSFHQPCVTFCSPSWGSAHTKFFSTSKQLWKDR